MINSFPESGRRSCPPATLSLKCYLSGGINKTREENGTSNRLHAPAGKCEVEHELGIVILDFYDGIKDDMDELILHEELSLDVEIKSCALTLAAIMLTIIVDVGLNVDAFFNVNAVAMKTRSIIRFASYGMYRQFPIPVHTARVEYKFC